MPFFLKGKKAAGGGAKGPAKAKKKMVKGQKRPVKTNGTQPAKKFKVRNEEILSSDDDDFLAGKTHDEEEEEEKEEETPQEKKVRLAKEYIRELKEQREDDEEQDDAQRDSIAHRLREDVLEAAGKLFRPVAGSIAGPGQDVVRLKSKVQKRPVTCSVLTTDDKFVFAASKDCSIVKYGVDGQRLGSVPGVRKGQEGQRAGHTSTIYSIDVTSDGKFLATGDQEGHINIWDAATLEHLKCLKKHRGGVSGLAFRRGSHTLYSAAADRLVMVWDVDAMAFVEHLGGHQDAITGLDSLHRESCISSGGRDQAIIVYLISEEKQLRFTGHEDSIDGVKLINEKTFITYGQDGAIGVWSTQKRRPCSYVKAAHGLQANGQPHWITALACLANTDLVASGSMDGFVRLWKVDNSRRHLETLCSIPVQGCVNSLAFTSSASHIVVGVGQEHRWGRWYKDKRAKNCLYVIPLQKTC